GTEVVIVLRPCVDSRMGRARADKLQLSEFTALAGFHPVLEAASGVSEQTKAAAHWSPGQAVGNPHRAIVVPAEAEVERQILFYFPIIFEEERSFVLIYLPDSLNRLAIVGELRVFRRCEPVQLRYLRQGTGEKRKQTSHIELGARGRCALESG